MTTSHLRPRSIMHSCLLLCILATLLEGSLGIRAKRTSFFLGNGNDDDDTTIRTEYVDRNNQTILDMFNLTRAQLSRIAAGNSAANKESSAPPRDSHYFEDIKELRLNDIKHRLQTAFQGGTSEESQEHPQHEMAAYPICNSDSNESSWLHDNNVTIRFSDSLFEPKRDNLNLDSAILRLYKVNPNGTDLPVGFDLGSSSGAVNTNNKPKRCADPLLDSQIRVTVSIVQQLRRNKQRKKRICNTIMMNVSQTGWVEIDIKRAIYIWESVERQQQLHHQQQQQQQQQQGQQQLLGRQPILVGWLMIEVHDEEERPLKPGLFFKPPKCDQADLAIPWNYYGPHASRSSFAADEVPRSPRLDVKLIGYASFAPKQLHSKELHDQLRLNLRRQLYHHLSYNAAEVDVDIDSSTAATPTVDNLLDSSGSTEVRQQRHRKRHLRHDPLEQLQQELQPEKEQAEHHTHSHQHQSQHHRVHHQRGVNVEQQQQLQQEVSSSTSSAESDETQQQHQHRQHRHHHNHHNHHHHPNHEQHQHSQQHQQQTQEESQQQQQSGESQQTYQNDC